LDISFSTGDGHEGWEERIGRLGPGSESRHLLTGVGRMGVIFAPGVLEEFDILGSRPKTGEGVNALGHGKAAKTYKARTAAAHRLYPFSSFLSISVSISCLLFPCTAAGVAFLLNLSVRMDGRVLEARRSERRRRIYPFEIEAHVSLAT